MVAKFVRQVPALWQYSVGYILGWTYFAELLTRKRFHDCSGPVSGTNYDEPK